MRLIAFACLVPIAVAAQSQVSPDDLCSIEGRVVNALTGEPVRKTELFLFRTDTATAPTGKQPRTYSTVAGADGAFAMKDLEPGSYTLSAQRPGFLRTEYGSRKANQRGTMLVLSAAQHLSDINLLLTPHGVISGRVVDEDSDPVVGSQVQLLRVSYVRGHRRLEPTTRWPMIETNDLGEYRVAGLQPGSYAVMASYRSRTADSVDRSATPRGRDEYQQTYYPGTTDARAVVLLRLEAGGEIRGIDVRLVKAHAVRVSGHITNSVLPGRLGVFVALDPLRRSPYPADATGHFEIPNVVPGSYLLQASISQGEKFYSARQQIEVRDEDLDNVNVTISPGVEVSLKVRVDDDEPADLNRLSFNLLPSEGDGGYFARKKEDSAISFESVTAGRYYLRAIGLPDGYYTKAAHLADRDVLASGLEVGSESAPDPVEVVLSPGAGTITGAVQNLETQRVAAFSVVTLVPQEKERHDQPWYYQTVTADQSGLFAMRNVVPGEYRIYAWDEIGDGADMDPDFLEPFESQGQAVSVMDGSQITEQLGLISTAGGPPQRAQ